MRLFFFIVTFYCLSELYFTLTVVEQARVRKLTGDSYLSNRVSGSGQWPDLGLVQKKIQKKIFKKKYMIFQKLYCILINIGLYFYTVKI